MRRRITLILCGVDLLLWAAIAYALFFSGSDPATAGLDTAFGMGVTVLLAITAGPALLLARRAPNLALACALAFPGAFVLAFLSLVLLVSS
jgi:hypothetical protein